MHVAERAKQGVAWTTLAAGGCAGLGLLQVAIAARYLERADFGLMALVMLVIGFSERLADAGLAGALLHRQAASRAELSSVFWLNLALGGLLCAGVAAVAPVYARLWHAPELASWLGVAGVVFVLGSAGQVSSGLLRRELRYATSGVIDLASGVASLALVAWLATAGQGVAALIAGLVGGAFVRSVLAIVCARDLFLPRFHFRRSELDGWVAFGAWQLCERVVNFASRNVDRVVIASWLGVEALGVYSLAYQLMARPYTLLANVANGVVRPLLARLQVERERVLRAFFHGVRLVALVAVPVYLGAWLVAGPLVALVYGAQTADVAAVFRWLCPLGVLYAVGNADGALVVATGKARVTFVWSCFCAAVHLAAVLVGVQFGLRGVAVALLAATLGLLVPAAFYLRWVLIRMPAGAYLASLARPLGYGAVMGCGVSALAAPLGGFEARVQLALLSLAGAAIYALLVWIGERRLLWAPSGES